MWPLDIMNPKLAWCDVFLQINKIRSCNNYINWGTQQANFFYNSKISFFFFLPIKETLPKRVENDDVNMMTLFSKLRACFVHGSAFDFFLLEVDFWHTLLN